MTDFKIGDVVRLNSGGPAMTVASILDNGDTVATIWFDGGEIIDFCFSPAELTAVQTATHGGASQQIGSQRQFALAAGLSAGLAYGALGEGVRDDG